MISDLTLLSSTYSITVLDALSFDLYVNFTSSNAKNLYIC